MLGDGSMAWPTMQEYQEALQAPRICFRDADLRDAKPVLDRLGLPKPISGGFASVYQLQQGGRQWAVRCFLRYHQDQERRYDALAAFLEDKHLPYMVRFEFLRQGILVRGSWYPVLKMEWVAGETLDSFVSRNLGNPALLTTTAERFASIVEDLRRHGIAHGDLQHGNILVTDQALKLIDYDGMYVPGLGGMLSHELGHRNYQHPNRTEHHFGPYLDNFSAWVIYLSLLAIAQDPGLWGRLHTADEYLLFKREDFEAPFSSDAFTILLQELTGPLRDAVRQLQAYATTDVEQIPPLQRLAIGGQRVATTIVTGSPRRSEGQPSAKRTIGSGSLTPSGSLGPAWVLDHLEPTLPVCLTAPSIAERAFALLGTLGAALLWAPAYLAGKPLALWGTLAVTPFVVAGFALVIMYRRKPVVRKKREIMSRRRGLDRKLRVCQLEEARLRREEASLARKERLMEGDFLKESRRLDEEEAQQLQRVHRARDTALAQLQTKRSELKQEESSELSKGLMEFQARWMENELSQHLIEKSTIPGIGPVLKARLIAAGICSAADIRSVRYGDIQLRNGHYIHVDWIGPKTAATLYTWRQGVAAKLAARMPSSLPQGDEKRIRDKYAARYAELSREEAKVKAAAQQQIDQCRRAAEQRRAALKQRFERDRQDLAKEQKKVTERLTMLEQQVRQIHWAIAVAERELQRYARVSVREYLRRMLRAR